MSVRELIRNSDPTFKKSLFFFLLAYFFVQLNYPLIRSSSTSLFFEAYGAKSSPKAWLWAVLFLSASITISSYLQTKFTIQKVFLLISGFSAGVFFVSTFFFQEGHRVFGYIPFVWKEIYIVLQIHILLAWANIHFRKEEFKRLVGIIGAVGSIGGVIGGAFTSLISQSSGTYMVMWSALFFVVLPAFFFWSTPQVKKEEGPVAEAPLASLTPEVRKYVALIALIVALTQFIINIADFNFNLAFEESVTTSASRTDYLGIIHMMINAVTFVFQFVLLPFVLPRVSERNYHLFIPVSYILSLGLVSVSSGGLVPVAALYVFFKASDYSLFSAGKEILYQPLKPIQKYGAKYLTDMLVYRAAKAMIAAVLIYLQSSTILNMMMIIFLILWLGTVINLFTLQRKIFS